MKDHIRISLIIIFLILIVSLFRLQIVKGNYFKQIATRNYVRIKTIKPIRGEIYDRQYHPVVTNIPSMNLYIAPGKIVDFDSLQMFLIKIFPEEYEELQKIINQNRYRLHQDILLINNLSQEKLIKISENNNYYPSLSIVSETTRNYAYKNHFTGYMGRINEKEYQVLKNQSYALDSMVGKTGLEKQYETILRGNPGRTLLQVDSRGRNLQFFKSNETIKATNGADLILTIDSQLQTFLQTVFPQNFKGSIIVINASTGGILGYLSYPEFDPNIFMSSISQKVWDDLMLDPAKPMLDRISHGSYPPGSVYKIIPALLGLKNGIITREKKLAECTGGIQIGNRFFKCWLHSGHGSLNVINAIKYSCDVFFYDLSLQLELEEFREFSREMMLSVPTGIDLPGERNGFFPTQQWYEDNYGKFFGVTGHKVNMSIGQGEILTTPLQIAAFYNAIANDGVWFQPHFVEKTIQDNLVDIFAPDVKELTCTKENIEIIQEALYKTVNEKWGTGTAAAFPDVRVYGKTGSAENHMGKDTHAWFAGYASWEKPEISFTIFLENAGHGGSMAAPIAGKIIEFWDNKKKMRS